MDIVNFDELGGEGFSHTVEDIRERIEDCGKPFPNEKLVELIQPPTSSDDDDDIMEDKGAQTPSDWTLRKLASIFQQAQVRKDTIDDYDPSMEHGIMVIRGITVLLKPLQDLFDEAKKRERQFSITMFFNKAPAAAEPNILRREALPLTSSRNLRTGGSPTDLRPPTESSEPMYFIFPLFCTHSAHQYIAWLMGGERPARESLPPGPRKHSFPPTEATVHACEVQ
ncbi:hypothetical protein TTRE_0000697401 [Trichuris trichiura]|uniref:Uncharacterized protein n=1 Tax=Trichuris trichiura TaxID=36087 RepID=A0A077ZJD1_TRITR|nr:hypothetical protein TTRE_0000697401 [Trichuris trichiura]